MSERLLGIDIDENILKAVLISRGLRGVFRVDLAASLDLENEDLAGALNKLGERVDFQQVQMNLSIPVEAVSFHNVKLPFREEKKIRQTFAFELETLLPHGIEDYVLGYNIISQSKQSEILAAAAPREAVKERLALFGEQAPEIGAIGVSSLSLASLMVDKGLFSGPGLLLDVGTIRVVAVFVNQGKIVQVRRYPYGQEHVEGERTLAALSTNREADFQGKKENQEINDYATSKTCQTLCNDISNALEFLRWGGLMEGNLLQIYLTGAGSLDITLNEELRQTFSLTPQPVDIAHVYDVLLPDGIRETWQAHLMNQPLSLALDSFRKGQAFNFSLRDLEKNKKHEKLRSVIKRVAAVGLISLLLLAVDSYLNYRYASLRLNKVKKEISTIFKAAAPEISRVVNPVQQLKVKIDEAKKISFGLGGIKSSGGTVLDVLKDVSLLIPRDTSFLIQSFTLEDDQVIIKGAAKNFDSVDSIKKELAKSKYIKSAQIGTTSLAQQGGNVEFDLRITLIR